MPSDNKSIELYRMNLKKGMPKEEAFFATLDHYFGLWLHDRNRYDERLRRLEEQQTRSHPE